MKFLKKPLFPVGTLLLLSLIMFLLQNSKHRKAEGGGVSTQGVGGTTELAGISGDLKIWLERVGQPRSSNQREAFLADGTRLAEIRKTRMLDLMRSHPDKALEQSLTWSEWAALPDELRGLVEQPFSTIGDYSVMSDCRSVEERQAEPWHLHHLTIGDVRLAVHPTRAWSAVISKERMPVQGIRLDGQAVLCPGLMQTVSAQDAEAVATLFPEMEGPVKPEDAAVVALIGGKRLAFENRDAAEDVRSALEEALMMPGPATAEAAVAVAYSGTNGTGVLGTASAVSASWSATPKRVIVLRLDFSDLTGAPQTQIELTDFLSTCSSWMSEVSYDKTSFSTQTVTFEVLRLPKTTAQYNPAGPGWNSSLLATDARAVATTAGYDFDDYDIVVYSFKNNSNVGGGFASIGAGDHWESATTVQTYAHEFGHNIGLPHANFWVRHQAGGDWEERLGIDTAYGAAGNDEYGDVFDVMAVHFRQRPGIENVWPNGHFGVVGKYRLGWMDLSRVIDPEEGGIFRIHRFDHADGHDHGMPLALTFQTRSGERVWAGLRRNFNLNATLSTGAYVVWEDRFNHQRQIDCTPFSQIDGITDTSGVDGNGQSTDYDHSDFDRDDSALAVGASWTSPDGSVRLTNLGVGGAAPAEYMDLRLEFLAPSHRESMGLYTDSTLATSGLTASFFDEKLLAQTGDWRVASTATATRIDPEIGFSGSSWGDLAAMGITGGTATDPDDFSVQWDGVVKVTGTGLTATFQMDSDDGSRMWVDTDNSGTFDAGELLDNSFGMSDKYPPFPPGTYPIRIQFEEQSGAHRMALSQETITAGSGDFSIYQDAALTNYGLTASYVNSSLRSVSDQLDWTGSQTISGTRADPMPLYWDNSQGPRSAVGVTGGTDGRWQNFSVQYDGWVRVHRATRFTTYAAGGARVWIDVDGNDSFASTAPEYQPGTWGNDGIARYAPFGEWIQPGTYRLRIQREIGTSTNGRFLTNRFAFMGQPQAVFNPGEALSLDGTGYITAPTPQTITGEFTVEAWVKPNSTNLMTILSTRTTSANYGFTMKIFNGTTIRAHIGDTSQWLTTNADVVQNYRTGEWMHLAWVVRSTGYQLFINSWLADEGSHSGTPLLFGSTHPLSIGRDGMFGEEFDGLIDEVRVWDRALSGHQIATSMRTEIPATADGLAGCWRMSGGDPTTELTGNFSGSLSGSGSLQPVLTPMGDQCGVLQPLPAEMGVTSAGAITHEDKTVWYSVELGSEGTIEFWTESEIDTVGTLYRVGLGGELVAVDDVGSERDFHGFYDAAPGTYYIGVGGYSNATGSYVLNLNLHDGIIPSTMRVAAVVPGGPILEVDTRPGEFLAVLEADDLLRWNYLGSPFLGDGGRISELVGTLAGEDHRYFRLLNSPARTVFAAKLSGSSSSPNSSTVLGQTAGFDFEPGVPENFGDTALELDNAPMTQEGGVTIISSASIGAYRVVCQAPGELTDTLATFPQGAWIASNTASGNEAAGFHHGLAHFPFGGGWAGGHISSTGTYLKTNTPPGFNILAVEPGRFNLWQPSEDISPSKGALFVIGAENVGVPNVVSTCPNLPPGSSTFGWQVNSLKADAQPQTTTAADWSFVYVPYDTKGMATGWVDWTGGIQEGNEPFTVTWNATENAYDLQIPSMGDLNNGTLLLTSFDGVPDGGQTRPADCQMEWNVVNPTTLRIRATTPPLADDVQVQCGFVFAYIPFDRVVLGPGQ